MREGFFQERDCVLSKDASAVLPKQLQRDQQEELNHTLSKLLIEVEDYLVQIERPNLVPYTGARLLVLGFLPGAANSSNELTADKILKTSLPSEMIRQNLRSWLGSEVLDQLEPQGGLERSLTELVAAGLLVMKRGNTAYRLRLTTTPDQTQAGESCILALNSQLTFLLERVVSQQSNQDFPPKSGNSSIITTVPDRAEECPPETSLVSSAGARIRSTEQLNGLAKTLRSDALRLARNTQQFNKVDLHTLPVPTRLAIQSAIGNFLDLVEQGRILKARFASEAHLEKLPSWVVWEVDYHARLLTMVDKRKKGSLPSLQASQVIIKALKEYRARYPDRRQVLKRSATFVAAALGVAGGLKTGLDISSAVARHQRLYGTASEPRFVIRSNFSPEQFAKPSEFYREPLDILLDSRNRERIALWQQLIEKLEKEVLLSGPLGAGANYTEVINCLDQIKAVFEKFSLVDRAEVLDHEALLRGFSQKYGSPARFFERQLQLTTGQALPEELTLSIDRWNAIPASLERYLEEFVSLASIYGQFLSQGQRGYFASKWVEFFPNSEWEIRKGAIAKLFALQLLRAVPEEELRQSLLATWYRSIIVDVMNGTEEKFYSAVLVWSTLEFFGNSFKAYQKLSDLKFDLLEIRAKLGETEDKLREVQKYWNLFDRIGLILRKDNPALKLPAWFLTNGLGDRK